MLETAFKPTVGSLKDPVPALNQRISLLESEIKLLHAKLLSARRELALLRGKDPQLALDELLAELKKLEALRIERELAEVTTPEPAQPTESKPAPRGHGPRPQPQLPEIEEIFELPPEDRVCNSCGGSLAEMGEQFEEFIEITVQERVYHKRKVKLRKYRCRCNSCIVTAPSPPRLIPGGRYSIDFATQVAIDKYLDHTPLERQVRQMDRQGLEARSQTLWDQLDRAAEVVGPTYKYFGKIVLQAPVLHADETRWRLLDGKTTSPWTVWTRTTPQIAHYTILSSKSAKAARKLFSGFEGIAVVDGYQVYETLARAGPKFRLANCWAHASRKFEEIEENFPRACAEILEKVARLYEVERQVPGPFPGDEEARRQRYRLRQEKSKPILEEMRHWAETEVGLPRSELGKAVRYMLKRWKALTLFVDHPDVPLDNNAAERSLRGPVVGRKVHYGSKSLRGTEVAAIFYTLLETAKLCGVEPAHYLRVAIHRALLQPGAITLPQDV